MGTVVEVRTFAWADFDFLLYILTELFTQHKILACMVIKIPHCMAQHIYQCINNNNNNNNKMLVNK